MAFKNGWIDLNDLRTGAYLKLYQPETANAKDMEKMPIFFDQIPHNFNVELYEEVKDQKVADILFNHAPTLCKFFTDIVGNDNINLQIAKIAYCLYRHNPFKLVFMEYGGTDSGKTTYLNLVRHILGEENVSGVSLPDLCNREFTKINLHHKLANINTELPKTAIRETGAIKALSGEDVVSANRKFKVPLLFKNYAKCFFATNQFPEVKDIGDTAYWGRWLLTEYPNTFKRNDAYAESLYNNEPEIEVVIVVSLMMLDSLLKVGFDAFMEGQRTKETWIRRSSPIYNFLVTFKERKLIELDKEHTTLKHDLLNACNVFIAEELEDVEPATMKALTEELERHYHIRAKRPRIKGKQTRENDVYEGIGLFAEPQGTADITPEQPQLDRWEGEEV